MNRKDICAFLIGCEAEEFMAYADLAERGCAVVGPDGKKYRFSNYKLQIEQMKLEPEPKPPSKAGTKRKPKPATKKSTKQSRKTAIKPPRSQIASEAKKE